MVLTTILDGLVGGWVALEEWKLRLNTAKVEVEVEAELGNKCNLVVCKSMKPHIFLSYVKSQSHLVSSCLCLSHKNV